MSEGQWALLGTLVLFLGTVTTAVITARGRLQPTAGEKMGDEAAFRAQLMENNESLKSDLAQFRKDYEAFKKLCEEDKEKLKQHIARQDQEINKLARKVAGLENGNT